MNDEKRQLVNGYLDGLLTAEQESDLNSWIKASPAHASIFAESVCFHDRLRNIVRGNLTENASNNIPPRTTTLENRSRQTWFKVGLFGGLIALAATIFIVVWSSDPPQANAATELDRLIEKADKRDRTYEIQNLDEQPELTDDKRPPIDGAMLHVRHPEQYVLVRKFSDRRLFVTGSDGEKSWSIPPNGAVRVSGDPMRFRGPVPGHQHGIPFADLRSDLVQLRDAYDLTPLGRDSDGKKGLLAIKKSSEHRGPNRVELRYDSATGVIHRMVFSGMPKARGGPDRVSVQLKEQRDLGESFFNHRYHHADDRRVIEED